MNKIEYNNEQNIKDDIDKIEQQLYEYSDKNVKDKARYYKFVDDLVKYENTKLEALKMDETFNHIIDNLRERFNVTFNEINKNSMDMNESFNINYYRISNSSMAYIEDPYFKAIKTLFEEEKSIIVEDEITYILVSYYILFNVNIREELLRELAVNSKNVVNSDPWCYQDIIASFDNIKREKSIGIIINEIRVVLNISLEDTIENRAKIYIKYYHYVTGYLNYLSTIDKYHIELFNLLNQFEFFNTDSELDYLLLHNYIVYNNYLDSEDVISVFGIGLMKVNTGEEILNDIHIINRDKLYAEIPVYANKTYLNNMVGYLYSKSSEHYKTTKSNQIPKMYYRDKAISELWDEINIKNRKMNDLGKRKVLEERIKEKFPNGYLNEKYFNKEYKDKYEKARINTEGSEAADIESSDKQQLKNMIENYKKVEENFKKERLR